jgi:dihydrofolate synthase/folylpolyglutamate synthase
MTLFEKIAFIESRPRFKPKTDLTHLIDIYHKEMLEYDAIKIHVVGTNGKGSTSKMLTDMLKRHYKVGTFMSPYVYTFNERILINGKPLEDHQLNHALDYAISLHEKYDSLTFFELLTLTAFKLFKELNLEILIMEAGIGGRLDSTNITKYHATILTSIGHDHLNILGPTLIDVLHEKIAVVKKGGILFSGADPLYTPYIDAYMTLVEASYKVIQDEEINLISYHPLTFHYHHDTVKLSYFGKHYAKNAALAIETIKYLKLNTSHIIEDLFNSTLFGRFEKLANHVYVDAAHNKESIEALVDTIKTTFSQQRFHIILSALGDKDIKSMISALHTVGKVYLTKFDDIRYVDISMHQNDEVVYFESIEQAYDHVMGQKQEDDIILFTGSIHFISQIKSKLKHTF